MFDTVSMMAHQRRMHWTDLEIDRNRLSVSQIKRLPQVYDISFPKFITQFPCPFPVFLVASQNCNGMLNHSKR